MGVFLNNIVHDYYLQLLFTIEMAMISMMFQWTTKWTGLYQYVMTWTYCTLVLLHIMMRHDVTLTPLYDFLYIIVTLCLHLYYC